MSDLDKISELQHQLDLLRAEVEKQRIAYVIVLKDDEAEKEEKENKRWRAEKGENYWTVSDYRRVKVDVEFGADSSGDNFRYDTHNYFQTEDEARRYAKMLETERQLKKFADEHNGEIDWSNVDKYKYILYYSYIANRVSINSVSSLRDARVIYFSSKEIAEQAIKTIGEEKIKEYLTYEW